jgi:hypothetical protein
VNGLPPAFKMRNPDKSQDAGELGNTAQADW